MADPWLTIVGIGEDGPSGLGDASRSAINGAEVVFGGLRHLNLARAGDRGHPWPIPFSIEPVLALRGQRVVVLVSGDPFWFGAGSTLADALAPGEWRALPAPSTFALAAARMGWRLEDTLCLGLHAAPFDRLRPVLTPGQQIIATLRDGAAPAALADWLVAQGFGNSAVAVLQALGGPREAVVTTTAADLGARSFEAPVAIAIAASGAPGLPATPGLPSDLFASDGQITKPAMRALTLAALAPRAGQCLWDIGAGSGSVSVEWALAAPRATAHALETRADRLENIRENAARFGLDHRITAHHATAPGGLDALPTPDAIFVGGGANDDLLTALWDRLPTGARLVANAVTLETEALLMRWHQAKRGQLLRMDMAEAAPLGRMQGWTPARPQLQWAVTR
ncbi:precorrin-6y C5,15-methyltransferase (decarboxylating) subunit CbiE [Actibacterium ureilyticum]|uniref:precorrin-6y C5,15-methyltransferase (decarboxylating) subunit CbiE n=1 Tax=Actibacterium ureilyticum TaxID=1590614 RepID=UPI000BAA991F|nr:precorrin-6y C5,15-methyltransferase (decarboxylating) subunit CbiE [Actibacterium ureilyticum]